LENFGILQAELRSKRGIARAELAEFIQKDPSYIRRIEIENYVPPFETCELISEKLKLTEEEKLIFFREAFFKRIDSNINFYKVISALESKAHSEIALAKNADFKVKILSGSEWKCACNYFLNWQIKDDRFLLSPQVTQAAEQFLKRVLQDLELDCHLIAITPTDINLIVEITPNYKIDDLVANLKTLCSGFLHTKFPDLGAPPDVWDQRVTISTIGSIQKSELPEELLQTLTQYKNVQLR